MRTLFYQRGPIFLSFHIPNIVSEAHSGFHSKNTRIFYPFYNVGESVVTEDYLLPSIECIESSS